MLLAPAARAEVEQFPSAFKAKTIAANGTQIHVRVGGQGPAVILIHGFGDTGDMWVKLAAELARDHTVVVPDLRGMGLSTKPDSGYDKWTQAADMRGVLQALGIEKAAVVGHDIGTMVAYAYAARYRDLTEKLVVMDAPVPGVPPWDEVVRSPQLWHFDLGGPDMERLVKGRERIYLDRFWNDFAATPSKITEATRRHYAELYARPGAMRADTVDNKKAIATKLTIPVLAVGGQKSFGATEAVVMRNAATDVTELVIPDAGHWLMEEQPAATVKAIRQFLDGKK
jgi:pimeloyl-ACP methyl ester carboxylesterase